MPCIAMSNCHVTVLRLLHMCTMKNISSTKTGVKANIGGKTKPTKTQNPIIQF